MGQAKQRRQTLGAAYGQPVAEQAARYVRSVGLLTESPVQVHTGETDGDCLYQACFTHRFLKAEGWDLQSGVVIAHDENFQEWDAFYQMGHFWLYHAESDTILDSTIRTNWPRHLAGARFRISPGALEATQVGLGRVELVPLLHRARREPTIAGHSVIYIPGLNGAEFVRLHPGADLRSLARSRHSFLTYGAHWKACAAATAARGECSEEARTMLEA